MERAFISRLKPFLDAVAEKMDLYVPRKVEGHYVCERYEPGANDAVELNAIRACTPAKEFLFPLRELAAVFPEAVEPKEVKPFAVFGLKACDLRSMEILDKVFTEKEFEDPFYIARRQAMFVIASDCSEPGESCFCNILDGQPYAESGFDLNVSQVEDGYIIAGGSAQGKSFLAAHAALFGDVPDALLAERQRRRDEVRNQLEKANVDFELRAPVQEIVERGYESDVFDACAATCVECQACTRVCPTCHCFYLYDTAQTDYFAKMKMWDSCMRIGYAAVAGGGNPRKLLGDRLRHRLMHKFAYFLERYGVDMCVGCGRCVDAEAGDVDIRVVLKRLSDELTGKGKAVANKTK
ncbi:MAG: 4Fe-4S dicluster domain-containing protein [Sedimentisphaerales bacterium]|nr:4Fe-4S dicluster domain-containing protein [Sedimentisphaerales bacterium]